GRLAHVTRLRYAEAQAVDDLEVGAEFPAVDLAGVRVVGLAEREVRVEALVARARFPGRYVDLREPFPHVEFTGGPRRCRERMHRTVTAGHASRNAANAECGGVGRRAFHFDRTAELVEPFFAIRQTAG